MSDKNERVAAGATSLVALWTAGDAIHWFLTPIASTASTGRTIAVGAQFLCCAVLTLVAYRRWKGGESVRATP